MINKKIEKEFKLRILYYYKYMELYIDKYIPQKLEEFIFNKDILNKLLMLSNHDNIPHLIINGPAGCGKKTFVLNFIMNKYNVTDLLIKNQTYEIKHGNKKIDVSIKYSPYHWQLNPSMYGVYDRTIIQELILDVLKTKAIGLSYHIIVIEDAHLLTKDAQQCLRRILEKYVHNCRFIFIINHEFSLIPALISRCIQFRLSAPNSEQMSKILENICINESIEYHINSVNNICTYSRHNLKYAINLLQIIALEFPNIIVNNNSIDLSQIILEDIHINKLIKFLPPSKDQINDIIQIKNILYDLLVHCVDPVIIMKKIYLKLLQTIKDVNKLTDILLKYEHTIRNGSKPIYHLEGFIIEIKKLLIIKII